VFECNLNALKLFSGIVVAQVGTGGVRPGNDQSAQPYLSGMALVAEKQ